MDLDGVFKGFDKIYKKAVCQICMQVAYVIGPYRSGKGEYNIKLNVEKAEQVALCLWRMDYAVICPHKNTAFLGGACDDKIWLEGDREFLRRSDIAVTVFGWEESEGSNDEVKFCRKMKMPLYHSHGKEFHSLDELTKDRC